MMEVKFIQGIRMLCTNPKCDHVGKQVTPWIEVHSSDVTGLTEVLQFVCPDCTTRIQEVKCSKT